MQSVDNLNEYWSSPAINWFDYFVDRKRFEALISERDNNRQSIALLAVQFSEQAAISERERDQLIAKAFPEADVQFSERKSACLWLCALSCFAAIDWDYDYLIEKGGVLSVRPLIDYLSRLWNNRDVVTDSTFGQWMFYRFVLSVDQRYRISPPPAKQTVNNPVAVPDASLNRFESIKRTVNETREQLKSAVKFMEDMIDSSTTITVPLPDCFLKPFIEGSGMAMSVGLLGLNVLIEGPPKPAPSLACVILTPQDVSNRARYDLVCHYFSEGLLSKAKTLLQQVIPSSSTHCLVSFNNEGIAGYLEALQLSTTSFPTTKTTENDTRVSGDSALQRWKLGREREGQARKACVIDNLASDAANQGPMACRHQLTDNVAVVRFVKSVHTESTRITNPTARARLEALLMYLCSTVPGLKDELLRMGAPGSSLRNLATPTARPSISPPAKNIIKALLNSDNPFWTVITSFDVTEIKEALAKIPGFKLPHWLKIPELLGDTVLARRPIVELHAVLLGKLQQLCRLRNQAEWQTLCNAVVSELGQLGAQNQMRFILEAIRVQTSIFNSKINLSWETFQLSDFQTHMKTTKALFSSPQTVGISGSTDLYKEVLALCLNARDYDFLIHKLDIQFPLSTLVQLMAAFASHAGSAAAAPAGLKALAEAFTSQVLPLFEISNRRDGSQIESARIREQLISFLRLVKEPSILPFLISFFAFLFNRILISDNKPQLKIFVQTAELFPRETELPSAHLEAVEECLQIVLRNGMNINPCNAFWIRTAADYMYAKSELNEASALYVEAILATKPSLTIPFPDNVIDDTVITRLKVCLNKLQCHTMAALLCQLLRQKRLEQYEKSVALIGSQICLDGRVDCCSMLFDDTLAEFLSQMYDQNRLTESSDKVISWCSSPALNRNNRVEVLNCEHIRRAERLLRVISSYIFGSHL